MLGKSAWLAGALAAGLLTVSPGTALAGGGYGGYGWGHGGYYHNHHLKPYGHRGFKHFRHRGHRGHGHFRGHGHRHFKPYGHRHFKHFGHRTRKHRHPHAFKFVFKIAETHAGYPGGQVAEIPEYAADGGGIVWSEPGSKAEARAVPSETYEEPGGRYCREFLTTANIGGQAQAAYGQACRQPDGTWEIVR